MACSLVRGQVAYNLVELDGTLIASAIKSCFPHTECVVLYNEVVQSLHNQELFKSYSKVVFCTTKLRSAS